ncbi:MAG: M48 family metallopeptidase [Candidatus Sedimenticola sp. 20ELBAFRAG]
MTKLFDCELQKTSSPQVLLELGEIEKVLGESKVQHLLPRRYRLGMVLSLLIMALLPLVYLLIIAGVAYVFWWHISENFNLLADPGGWSGLMIYIGGVIVSGMVLSFLIWPLQIFFQKHEEPRTEITESQAPGLFRLVRALTNIAGAPIPERIFYTGEVNAAAAFRPGLANFISGNLELHIGVPLLRGMTISELAGILSHEFGHFGQGAGMRTTYALRNMHNYLSILQQFRLAWRQSILQATEDWDIRVKAIVWLGLLGMWITSLILKLLELIGHLSSHYLLRQMEFEADQYEIQVVGGAGFKQTFLKLILLEYARKQASEIVAEASLNGRMPEDFIALWINRASLMNEKEITSARTELEQQTSSSLDTHPPYQEREKKAQAWKKPALVQSETCSAVLLSTPDKYFKNLSADLIATQLGYDVQQFEITPNQKLIAHAEFLDVCWKWYETKLIDMFHPLAVPRLLPANEVDQKINYEDMDGQALQKAGSEAAELWDLCVMADCAICYRHADISIDPNTFHIGSKKINDFERELEEKQARYEQAADRVRIIAAPINLAFASKVEASKCNLPQDQRKEVDRLQEFCQEAAPLLEELIWHLDANVVDRLAQMDFPPPDSETAILDWNRRWTSMSDMVRSIGSEIAKLAYPLGEGRRSFNDAFGFTADNFQQVEEALQTRVRLYDSLMFTFTRSLGRIIWLLEDHGVD